MGGLSSLVSTASLIGMVSASTGLADSYAIEGNSPPVAADFVNEYYRVSGSASDFPTMFDLGTTTAYPTSLRTMVDSDGLLKWGPHNVSPYSEDFTNWVNNNSSDTAGAPDPAGGSSATTITASAGTALHDVERGGVSFSADGTYKFNVFAKAGTHDFIQLYSNGGTSGAGYVNFDLSLGTVGTSGAWTGSISNLGDGFYLCTATFTAASTAADTLRIGLMSSASEARASSFNAAGTETVILYGVHVYRSDLGGMVDVPVDQRVASGSAFAAYVPTTTTARYLHRRGNHVYNGTSWVNKGILIETEARTNLETQSVSLSNYTTNVNNLTATTGQTDPNGGSNAVLLEVNAAATAYSFGSIPSDASTKTFSAWLKAGTSSSVRIQIGDGGTGGGVYADVNLSAGTIGAATYTGSGSYTAVTSAIQNFGGGWYRASVTVTTPASAHTGYIVETSTTIGNNFYVYGPQIEVGSTPSSYIPTAGTAVTRNADSLVIAAANMSASTSAMSLQLNGTITYADEGAAAQQTFLRWQTDANNYISLDLDTDGAATGEVNANQAVGGTVDTVVAGAEYTAGVNVAFNIASRHTSGAINVAKDGTAATADTTPASLVDLSARDCELFQDAMGNISQFRQWAVDLGDTGIETASS